MQAALERYLSDKKYPYSLITGREFTTSRAVLDAKAKQLRMNGYGKRQNRAQRYNSYVEDFEVVCIQIEGGEMAKCVRLSENPTKTRTGGLTAKYRKTPQEMWATDGGSRDPVRLFEEFLRRRPSEMRTSGPLYLTIIQRPKTEVWYAKSKTQTRQYYENRG